MDDDDEFGDLYTDVLRPFATSSAAHQQPPAVQSAATDSQNRPIDLNINSDDEEILLGAPNSRANESVSYQKNQSQVLKADEKIVKSNTISMVVKISDGHRNLNEEVNEEDGLAEIGNNWDDLGKPVRDLGKSDDVKVTKKTFENPNLMDESGINVIVEEREGQDDILVGKDENMINRSDHFENIMDRRDDFDKEEVDAGIEDMGSGPMIPGLSTPGVSGPIDKREGTNFEDDWDSDSEDDLQIVLNDNNHGPMAIDGGVMRDEDDDDDDEDGEPLVIVADSDNMNHQQMTEEQDWGEDAAQGVDSERKELNDAAKANGGVAVAPKIGYSNHGYHPFHSQFKYVRPGATPIPGNAPVGPGGVQGQVRPPANMGVMAGRGRGDWRPMGMKNASAMQKGFHAGYGVPMWGNNASGRGFGNGLEFTLPSHKTIFEVDIDSFEEKPWALQGIDISDYFNFGLNEEGWKDYCKQLEQLRLETTMQSKIRVYESGRTEQEYDPDLPPELAAATATGIHEFSSENTNLGKTDAGQSDLVKGSVRVRPPLPTGRPIQVETGSGERLPSIDTRPPRIRDSDAIIEIVLQDSADDEPYPGVELEQPVNGSSREVHEGGEEIEDSIAQENNGHVGLSHAFNERKRDIKGRRESMDSVHESIIDGEGLPKFPSEVPSLHDPDSKGREQTSAHTGRNLGIPREDRQTKGRECGASPVNTPSECAEDKRSLDDKNEESVESIDDSKHRPLLSSPVSDGAACETAVEEDDAVDNEHVLADGSSEMERDITKIPSIGLHRDASLMHSTKRQKLSSRVEQPVLQDADDIEDSKAARSSENSKARSGSSNDFQKFGDSVDDEVLQDGRSISAGNRRPLGDNELKIRRKSREERRDMERHHMSVKGREDSTARKNWDSNMTQHSHVKAEGIDRRKDSDNSDGGWQRRDEDAHGRKARAEDSRKRERSDEIGSRNRGKLRENERSDKDDPHHLRKPLDNGTWRMHHDKDTGSRHRDREDTLKNRNENMDDIHKKKRKEEMQLRRDRTEKEEALPIYRESVNRRRRERDDTLDQRKRDEQTRIRGDDQHSIRHKEENWYQRERVERQRERDEWVRVKQAHEESSSKREEGRGGVRNGRTPEDKSWVSHSRMKEDYKGSDKDHHIRDVGRHSDQPKRRDRVDNESLPQNRGREDVVYVGGNPIDNDERRARHERASYRPDRSFNASDSHKMEDKKNKEHTRKVKESEGGDHNSSASLKRSQEDHSGQMNEMVSLKRKVEQVGDEHGVPTNHHPSRKNREDGSSDDEQHDAKRGRSKLERWASHKDKDFSVSNKSSSSSKSKVMDTYNLESSLGSKIPDESTRTTENLGSQHSMNEKGSAELVSNNVDAKPVENRHLDTVAKLKKRSERFKLPMPSEKEAMSIKKMESEPLPSDHGETRTDAEIKQERPARKRRWTNN